MRVSAKILDAGDPLPALTMQTVAHGSLQIPAAFKGGWGVFLVYRGHW
jgi:hypothetical protein